MKTFIFLCLISITLRIQAQTEIDLPNFSEFLRFPGLPLEIEDHTERESSVRNINFKKVLYLKVNDKTFIYPAVIYIGSAETIDKAKYDKIRKMIREADVKQTARLRELGFSYFPELDNAVVSLDEIRASKYIPSPVVEGGRWITPMMGGLSITATNDNLDLDYQIFLTGQAEDDPEIMATYRKDLPEPSRDEFRQIIEALIHHIRDSPMLANAAIKVTPREDRRSAPSVDHSNELQLGSEIPQTAENRTTLLKLPLWQWTVWLIILVGMVILFIRRAKR